MRMEIVDESGDGVVIYWSHFVFAVVDGTFAAMFFTVGHGVSNTEPAHEFWDSWFGRADVFGEDEMKMIGEKKKWM